MTVDWGSVPAWVSLCAASAAAGIALRNLALDRDDRRRKQAEQINVWLGTYLSARNPEFPDADEGAWILNSSGSPVYDVVVEFHSAQPGDGAGSAVASGVLPPVKDGGPLFFDFSSLTLIDPDNPPPRWTPTSTAGGRLTAGDGRARSVRLGFRDAAGRSWLRDDGGKLIRSK